MSEYHSGAYFVRRGRGGRGSGGGRRAAGALIAILLLLTAAICLLVVFLPRLTSASVSREGFGGKTFYFLAVGKYPLRDEAVLSVQDTTGRGGAGYIYNDGSYNVIAAVYDSEADAKALASVNAGSFYFALSVPKLNADAAFSVAALDYLANEWFSTLQSAADELQRGNTTEAQAERAAASVCAALRKLSENIETPALEYALESASEYDCPQNKSVLSYIHYVRVRGIALVAEAMN